MATGPGRDVEVLVTIGGKSYPAPTLSTEQRGTAIRLTIGRPERFVFPATTPIRDVVSDLLARLGGAADPGEWLVADEDGTAIDLATVLGGVAGAETGSCTLALSSREHV